MLQVHLVVQRLSHTTIETVTSNTDSVPSVLCYRISTCRSAGVDASAARGEPAVTPGHLVTFEPAVNYQSAGVWMVGGTQGTTKNVVTGCLLHNWLNMQIKRQRPSLSEATVSSIKYTGSDRKLKKKSN